VGFPENVLANDEKVVRHLHPHWLSVATPAAVAAVLLVVAAVVAVVTPDTGTGNVIQWIVVAIAVISLLAVIPPLIRWRSTHYVVTTHRVMVRRGILTKSGKDITLSKITDVSYRQSLLDRMIGAGALHIESAGDSPDEDMASVPNSDEVQQLINRLIDEDDLRRRRFGNQAWGPPSGGDHEQPGGWGGAPPTS
jgi:uncharacterized membrane protein YdbT with pleckstrin-like domain